MKQRAKAFHRRTSRPEFQVKFQRWLKWFWFFSVIPIETVDNLKNSITLIIFISIYANFISHWSTERALEAQLEARPNSSGKNEEDTRQVDAEVQQAKPD